MKKSLTVIMAVILATVGMYGGAISVDASEDAAQSKLQNCVNCTQLANDSIGLTGSAELNESSEAEEVEGEVLVMFEDDSELTLREQEKVDNLEEGDALAKKVEIEETWDFAEDGAKLALVSSDSLDNAEMVAKLEKKSIVAKASPNYKRTLSDVTGFSEDTYSKYQWMLSGDSDTENGISVKSEWDTENTGKKEVVVAVIDTGIDYTNEDLKNQMWKNPYQPKLRGRYGFDFANGDEDPMDDFGHGSHCAGIIGAEGDNNTGISGVNKSISLMALKTFDNEGNGDDASIISAYNYIYKAIEMGVNVAAVNCSFGGSGANEIMLELINMVGEKGAVTVAAAGNEATDFNEVDETEEDYEDMLSYPACYDSPYIITVAATKEDGEIVSFSNRGDKYVDVAAPGADILSTVNYETYLPGLQATKGESGKNNIYTDGSSTAAFSPAVEEAGNMIGSEEIESLSTGGFIDNKNTLKIHFSEPEGEDEVDFTYAEIDYTVPEDFAEGEDTICDSLMIKTDGEEAEWISIFEVKAGYVAVLDVPIDQRDELLENDFDSIYVDYEPDNVGVSGEGDYWKRISATVTDAEPGQDRCLLIMGQCQNGDFDAYIDDIGISKPVCEGELDKLDYYSGTSMATPCVTGMVALNAAKHVDDESYSAEEAISTLLSSVDDEPRLEAVSTKGSADFAKQGTGYWLGIGNITVDPAEETITIKGGDFSAGDIKVEISGSIAGEEKNSTVTDFEESSTKDELVFKDPDNYINNVVDIKVIGKKNGKERSCTRKNVYLVKGKKSYEELGKFESDIGEITAITTDGKDLLYSQSEGDSVYRLDTESGETAYITYLNKGQANKIFDSYAEDEEASHDFRFGDDIVYMDGRLYVIGAFCEVSGSEYDDEDIYARDDNGNGRGLSAKTADEDEPVTDEDNSDDEDEDLDMLENGSGAAYTTEYALLSTETEAESGSFEEIELPEELDSVVDFNLTAYNGKLYIAGGYDYSTEDGSLSKAVYCYNADDDSWDKAAELPEGRAGGKLIQTGDKLVYTLGYTGATELKKESTVLPANLVFDGTNWTKSEAKLYPFNYRIVSRNGADYADYEGSVGICENGLVYIGLAAEQYGDTYTYDVTDDCFGSLEYNYSETNDGSETIIGTAIGEDIIGYTQDAEFVKAESAIRSGLISITAGKYTGGKIKGTGEYLPGEKFTVKTSSNYGYYTKSLKVCGKSATKTTSGGMYISGRANINGSAKASFGKMSIKLPKTSVKIKAGKKYSIGAKISPTAAAKQWKLSYKTSNSKYATVSSKGVITAKKAGKGKTLKITVYSGSIKTTGKTMKVTIR